MEINIKLYKDELKQDWFYVNNNSKNGNPMFERNYMEYHKKRFEDISSIIYFKNKPVILFPANKHSEKIIYSHEGLTFGGFIIKNNLKLIPFLKCIRELMRFYFEMGFTHIKYKMQPSIYRFSSDDDINYLLFLMNSKLYRVDTTLAVNINKYEFSKIRKLKKVNIKKSLKSNLIIKEEDNFKSFWSEILEPNLLTKYSKKPVHSIHEIEYLKSKNPKLIRQFNIYSNDKIIAGTTIYESERVAHAQYISSSLEGRSLGALDFLFNHLIENEFSNKMYFDFGIVNENDGKFINEGLLFWKDGFNSEIFSHQFYEIQINNFTQIPF